jgi:hypothetical protein
MKMEQTQCSETSAIKHHTPGNNPKDYTQQMKILPFCSRYIFSVLLYVVNNKCLFTQNLEAHSYDTSFASDFHLPITNLTKYQNGAHYPQIKIVSNLQTHMKCSEWNTSSSKDLKEFSSWQLVVFYW